MTERKRITVLIGATALSVLLVALASRLPAPAPLVAGIGVIPLALLLMVWRRCAPPAESPSTQAGSSRPPPADSGPRPPAAGPTAGFVAPPPWTEAVMAELPDAALLMDGASHRLISANAAACSLFGRSALPAGLELVRLLPLEPVLRARSGLRPGQTAPLTAATAEGAHLVRGKLRLLDRAYLLVLSAADTEQKGGLRSLAMHRASVRDLRRPLANLRAAAETVAAFPDMTPRERAAFDEVVSEECCALSRAIERLEGEIETKLPAAATTDLHSQDLFNCLARRLGRDRLRLNMVGIPLWLHGDANALLDAFAAMARHLAAFSGHREFDFEALLADRRVYIDLAWTGPAVPAAMVDLWLDQNAGESGETLRDLLDRHGCEPWSQRGAAELSVLRVPLPPPERPQFLDTDRPTPPRPEVHDLDLMQRHLRPGTLNNERLAELSFVAFDCETTGLRPDQGDRLVQIGAVRVFQGRVQSGDGFERLIDPGRPIPPTARMIHGIDDDMVRGKPPLSVVLPQFAAFAGGAVLVGHNVAFDLGFLDAAQGECGLALRQPVLDTMILAALLDPGYDLSLAALAERLGVPPLPHRSALSDALVTAEVLARMIPPLEAKGYRTLGQLSQASLDWLTAGGGQP